ncbi:MAG: hypothetical protein J7K40_05480 [candidate division Zixibacteria bacterium]|nr:hypothetical protein [candidate division Zixibacteria bacterium]
MLQEVQSRINQQKEINPEYIEHRLFQLDMLTGRIIDRFWQVDTAVQTEIMTEIELLKKRRRDTEKKT